MDPDWWISPQVQMLREVHQELQVIAWQKTKDATSRNPQHYPTRLALTKAEVEAERAKNATAYEPTTISEMRDFLGWDRYDKSE